MSATLIYKKREYEIRHGMTIQSALKKMKILPESIIPTKNGELVIEDELIEEGDVIKLIAVISGG